MKLETTDNEQYLVSDAVVDGATPSVSARAQELSRDLPGGIEKARRLFEWVRDEIPHTRDVDADAVTCTASEVLQAGTGICYAKSHLLAALLRAAGVPAGFCYQVLRRTDPHEGFVLHGLNGVYLEELDRWIRVDPRGNTGQICAQFCIEEEQLAFPTNPSRGEFIYETIFACPAPEVVRTLNAFSSRTEMWPHLPSRLADEAL
ncbi:MAG: transglutaminase family protein [Candidatus Latescibacteria bacterium]|jgi:hypothetical protein|nr:transglutaminase family protein [Candidatus Latescibacterota bacterium]